MKYTIPTILLSIFLIAITSSCEKCNPVPPIPVDTTIIKGEWISVADAPVTHFYPNKLFVDETENLMYAFTDSSLCVYNGQTWTNLSDKFTFEDFFDIEKYNNKIFLALNNVKFNGIYHYNHWIISWNGSKVSDSIEVQKGKVYALASNESELIISGNIIDTINNEHMSNNVIGYNEIIFYPEGDIEINNCNFSKSESYRSSIYVSDSSGHKTFKYSNFEWIQIEGLDEVSCIKVVEDSLYIAEVNKPLLKYDYVEEEYIPVSKDWPFDNIHIHNVFKKDSFLYIAKNSTTLLDDSISVPRWDGNNWKYLKSAIPKGYGVYDIVDFKNELYTVCYIDGKFKIYKWIPEQD